MGNTFACLSARPCDKNLLVSRKQDKGNLTAEGRLPAKTTDVYPPQKPGASTPIANEENALAPGSSPVPDDGRTPLNVRNVAADGCAYQGYLLGPPEPPCNEDRLKTVQALNAVTPVFDPALIDAPPDPELNSILKLIASVFHTPAALVALFDDKRIFIRDSEGAFKKGDFPWRMSFCGYTMSANNDQIMVIPDATKDPRFCKNPAVLEFGVRFYAGTPLIASNGHRLGTLCFADFTARVFDAASAHILNNLAELVVRHVEKDIALQVKKRTNVQLNEAYHTMKRTLDCFEHSVGLIDTREPGWKILYTNRSWNKMAGLERAQMSGKSLKSVFSLQGDALPLRIHESHAQALLVFRVTEVTLLPQEGAESGACLSEARGTHAPLADQAILRHGSHVLSGRGAAYNLTFRPASVMDLDDEVLPIGVPSFLPHGADHKTLALARVCDATDVSSPEAMGEAAQGLYFVTLEPAKDPALHSEVSLSSTTLVNNNAWLSTPESITGLKMGLLVGKGGYGSVYRARLFGTQVAVKIIEQEVAPQVQGAAPPPSQWRCCLQRS